MTSNSYDDIFFSYEQRTDSSQQVPIVEWDKDVSEVDKWDYAVATISGALSSVLDFFCSKHLSILEAHNWGKDKIEKFVLLVSQLEGYKGADLKKAIYNLERNHPFASDALTNEFGGGRQHHLRDYSHHASLSGLIFSIFSHTTGICVGTNKNGELIYVNLPDDVNVGNNIFEKIYLSVIGWAMHIISDMAGSSSDQSEGTGVVGPILSFFKTMSNAPIFNSFKIQYKDDSISFSQIVSKLFNGTATESHVPFDLRTEIGILSKKSSITSTLSLALNECIIRAFYSIRRFFFEIQDKQISSLLEIKKLDWKRILPFNNRTITRMITVSSGVFVTITTAKAAICASRSAASWASYLVDFAININYVGIARFTIALVADSRYIFEDTKELCYLLIEKYKLREPKKLVNVEKMFLTSSQIQLLYSLKLLEIEYDISQTKNKKAFSFKQSWKNAWKEKVLSQLNPKNEYFLDEKALFEQIKAEKAQNDSSWYYLILMESLFFVPYYPLDNFKSSKSIHASSNFERDILFLKYDLISSEQLDRIKKSYNKFISFLDERKKKKLKTIIITNAVLAPGLIMPDLILLAIGFVEISKCVDTMLGDGTLYGFLGANISIFTSTGIVLNECAKLLTYCDCFLKEAKTEELSLIKSALEYRCEEAKKAVISLNSKKNKENKSILNSYKKSSFYLTRALKALANI